MLAWVYLCENIILESDNLEIIEACISGTFPPDEAIIINDILDLKKSFLACGLTWAPK